MPHDLARLPTEPAYSSWPIDCAELDVVANSCPMDANAAYQAGESEAADRGPLQADRNSEAIVFIDSGVSDISAIVKAASLDGEVVMLDPGADGLAQIASHLAGRSRIKRISLLAPGCADGVLLGNASLTSQSLTARQKPAIEAIRRALGDGVELVCVSSQIGAPCQSCVLAPLAEAIGGRLIDP